MTFQVAAFYHFAPVAAPEPTRAAVEAMCLAAGVRGTILVATEGVNGTVAGPAEGVADLLAGLRALPGFAGLKAKLATSEEAPFRRLKVKVKAEIVTLGRAGVDAAQDAGVRVPPADWNALIADPDTLTIDTRNDYEGVIGAFEGAVQPNTRSFRDFPAWFESEGRALIEARRPKRVAMYCTGGIRCEKSTALLKGYGVEEVHHLDGGVLQYLEDTPEADSLWRGECFVFDERVAVGHGLAPGSHTLCRGCRMPVGPEGRASPLHVEGVSCARCHGSRPPERLAGFAERQRQMDLAEAQGREHLAATQPPPAKRSL